MLTFVKNVELNCAESYSHFLLHFLYTEESSEKACFNHSTWSEPSPGQEVLIPPQPAQSLNKMSCQQPHHHSAIPRVTGSKTELLILKVGPRKRRHPWSLITEGAAYLACIFLRLEEKSHRTVLQDSGCPSWHSSARGPTDNEKRRTLTMFSEQKGTVISAL